MATEPWELTQAFAQQLMQNANNTQQQATKVGLVPIQHAMALERLKEQAKLNLEMLPQELAIQDKFNELREGRAERRQIGTEERGETRTLGSEQRAENRQIGTETRAYGRQQETEQRGEGRAIATENRAEERLPRTLKAQTDEAIRQTGGNIEEQIKAYQKYGEAYERARNAGRRGTSTAENALRPPTRPDHEAPEVLPIDLSDRNRFIKDLDKKGFIVTGTEGYRGHNYVHYKKKPTAVQTAPMPTTMSPAGKADNRLQPPLPPRPTDSIPFDAVPQPPGEGPLPPTRPTDPLGGKDKMSFLYESIRRRGYTDEEAKTILASMQPQVKPTDDPDIFDVLVS